MNLQFVKYFVSLAEEQNFTKAAQKNFVVQSTFSSGIKKLEQELGKVLFYRDKRNVNLTQEGKLLLPKAKALLTVWNTIANAEKEETKSLKIGVLNSIHHADTIVPTLQNFQELYSSHHFELKEGGQDDLIQQLRERALDIAFIQDQDLSTSLFNKRFVYRERLEVMLSTKHVLAAKSQIKLAELHDLPFIAHDNCILNKEVNQAFEEQHITVRKVFNAQHSDMLASLVAADLGFALLAKSNKHTPNTLFIPLADANFERDIYLVWLKDDISKPLKHFLSV